MYWRGTRAEIEDEIINILDYLMLEPWPLEVGGALELSKLLSRTNTDNCKYLIGFNISNSTK